MERFLCVFQAFLFTKTKSNWIKFQLRNKIRYFLHYFAPGDTFRNTTPTWHSLAKGMIHKLYRLFI